MGGVGPKLVGFLANSDPAAKKCLGWIISGYLASHEDKRLVNIGKDRMHSIFFLHLQLFMELFILFFQMDGPRYAEWTGKAMTADNLQFELRQVQESNLEDVAWVEFEAVEVKM